MKFKAESEKEKEVLKKFREVTEDLQPDDDTLLRFLRGEFGVDDEKFIFCTYKARELDITRAEDMLRKSIQWRKDNDVSSYINYEIPATIKDNFVYDFHCGLDHEGRPVIWMPLVRWNPRPIFDAGLKDECCKFRLFLFEYVRDNIKRVGASQVVCVLGLEQLTYDKIANLETMQLLYSSLKELEANYPEILKTCIVINAPWIFPMAYNFFKPIFSRRTLNKLKVFDSDRNKWLPQLLEQMPMSTIPAAYRDADEP